MRNAVPDLLRVTAALLVLVGHGRGLLLENAGHWFERFTGLGMTAVMIFFAVSGYSIATEARAMTLGFGEFLIRRLTRLWVVLIPAIVLTLALDLTGVYLYGPSYGPHVSWNDFPALGHITIATLAGNIAFLQTILTESFGSNTALWSLSLEFWCYIAFYLRRTLWAPLIVVAISALLPHFLILAGIWALGALAVYAKPRAYLAGFLTALLVWALLFGPDYISQWAFYGFVGALTAAVLATTAPFRSGAITLLSNSSYSLYAIHMPILVLMAAGLGVVRIRTWFACMAIALAAAYVFSRLTEAHTGKVRQLIARGFPFRYPTPDAVRYSDE